MNIPYVSQSRISLYRDCPFAYCMRYSHEGEKFPQPKIVALDNGNAMHKAIEDSLRKYRATGEWDSNSVIKNYIKYATKYGLGQDIVKEMSKVIGSWAKKYNPPPNMIGIEERHEISIDGVRVVAVMDMVEVDSDDNLVIHDWKSNVQPYSGEKMEQDIQAPLYLFLAKKLYPDHKGYKFMFHFIRNDLVMEYEYEESDLEFNWFYIKSAYEAIKEDDKPEARPSFICASCPGLVHEICPLLKQLREHGVDHCIASLEKSLRKGETFVDETEISKLIAEKKALQGMKSIIDGMTKVVNTKLMNYLDAKDVGADVVCGYKISTVSTTTTTYDPMKVWMALEKDQVKLKKSFTVRKTIVDGYIKDGSIGKTAGKDIMDSASKKSNAPYIMIRKTTSKKTSKEEPEDDGW